MHTTNTIDRNVNLSITVAQLSKQRIILVPAYCDTDLFDSSGPSTLPAVASAIPDTIVC